MNLSKLLFAGSMLLLFPLFSHAQWGSVTPEMVKEAGIAPFESEDVVVLQDIGKVQMGYFLERYVRVKIQSSEGLDAGNVEIELDAVDEGLGGLSFKGQIHYVDESGEVRADTVVEEDLFIEQISGRDFRITCAFPKVKVGAVLEYSYLLVRQNSFDFSWAFQNDYPTKYSELKVLPTIFSSYEYIYQGDDKLDLLIHPDSSNAHWVMYDVPAFKPEPFVGNLEDYRPKMMLQRKGSVNFFSGTQSESLNSWKEFNDQVLSSGFLGKYERPAGPLNKVVKNLITEEMGPLEKLDSLHRFVSQNLSWNGEYAVFTGRSVKDIYKSGRGTSGEINLVLLNLLRAAGFEANPLLISTKDNGAPIKLFPIFDQFNSLIVQVVWHGEILYCDATDPYQPYTHPPLDYLNTEGWLLHPTYSGWSKVVPLAGDDHQIQLFASMKEDGTMNVRVKETFEGYVAGLLREFLSGERDSTDLVEYLESYLPDFQVETASAQHVDRIDKPLILNYTVTSESYATVGGDRMYFNALLAWANNDYREFYSQKERQFPIDFILPEKTQLSFSLFLPEGWEVEEVPPNTRTALPNSGIVYEFLCDPAPPMVQLRSTFVRTQTYYNASDFKMLKNLFSEISKRESGQIVLRRKED